MLEFEIASMNWGVSCLFRLSSLSRFWWIWAESDFCCSLLLVNMRLVELASLCLHSDLAWLNSGLGGSIGFEAPRPHPRSAKDTELEDECLSKWFFSIVSESHAAPTWLQSFWDCRVTFTFISSLWLWLSIPALKFFFFLSWVRVLGTYRWDDSPPSVLVSFEEGRRARLGWQLRAASDICSLRRRTNSTIPSVDFCLSLDSASWLRMPNLFKLYCSSHLLWFAALKQPKLGSKISFLF